MHIAFIIDNSPTMQQKGCNNLSLIDYAKGSIQNTVKNISRTGFPGPNDFIHLFKTSQPLQPVSSYQHQSLHFNYQLKTIQSQFPTYPTETISQVYKHISKFRVLSTNQNIQGYRQGDIYDPALIIFLTDKMTKRHIYRLLQAVKQNKFQMRSQYQFLICRICPPALSQKNVNTFDLFKKQIESQQQTALLTKLAQSLNGQMKLLYNHEQITQSLTFAIQNFKPSLCVQMGNRQFPNFSNCFKLSKVGSLLVKEINNLTFRIWMIPQSKKSRLLLPYKLKVKQENHQPQIDKAHFLKFYVDFSKTISSGFSTNCPIERYKFNPNQILWNISKSPLFQKQQRYPIFYINQQRDHEILQNFPYLLIGVISINSNQFFQIQIYPPNFITFDSIIQMIHQKNNYKFIQSAINNYLNTIPPFYFSYIHQFLQKVYNIKISQPNFYNCTYALNSIQIKISQYYSVQRKRLIQERKNNTYLHSNNLSECCLIYSSKYNHFNKNVNASSKGKSLIQSAFNSTLATLLDLKAKLEISDYISNEQQSTPMTKQLQKYTSKKGQDFDENLTLGDKFGNPFKKKRKLNSNSSNSSETSRQQIKELIDINFLPQDNNQVTISLKQRQKIQQENKLKQFLIYKTQDKSQKYPVISLYSQQESQNNPKKKQHNEHVDHQLLEMQIQKNYQIQINQKQFNIEASQINNKVKDIKMDAQSSSPFIQKKPKENLKRKQLNKRIQPIKQIKIVQKSLPILDMLKKYQTCNTKKIELTLQEKSEYTLKDICLSFKQIMNDVFITFNFEFKI